MAVIKNDIDAMKVAPCNCDLAVTNREIDAWEDKLEQLETKVDEAVEKLEPLVETADNSDTMDWMKQGILKQMSIDVHRRKYSLIISGIPGPKGETAEATEKALADFAAKHLKRKNVLFHATHRLRQAQDAPIIAKFVKLTERDAWLQSSHL